MQTASNDSKPSSELRAIARRDVEDLILFGDYLPYGSALDLFLCPEDEVLLSGPAGTGKSRGCLEKIHFLMLRYLGARALIVRKTRASLNESGLFTYERYVLGESHPLVLNGPTRPHRHSYRYENGSEVVVGGMDKPTRIMSTEFDIIYVQEAIELSAEDLDNLTTRLRNGVIPYQQLIADTNPDKPQHHVKVRCNEGRMRILYCRHEDNPRLYNPRTSEWTPEGLTYIKKLDNLTGVRRERLRFGKWVGAEGLVYSEYDEQVHLLDRNTTAYGLTGDPDNPIPDYWRRFLAVDFGYTNPFVCQWWAVDPDGRMFRYREIYMTKRLVSEHGKQIKRLSEGETISAVVCDHDAEDRATLRAASGLHNSAAYKAISRGIEAVQVRLKQAGDGKARIFLLRDSLVEADEELRDAGKPYCTEQEFPGYVYPKGEDGKPNKEEPVDLDNHGMDATRYAVAYEDISKRQGGGAVTSDRGGSTKGHQVKSNPLVSYR